VVFPMIHCLLSAFLTFPEESSCHPHVTRVIFVPWILVSDFLSSVCFLICCRNFFTRLTNCNLLTCLLVVVIGLFHILK
jgi:hypothetical protein